MSMRVLIVDDNRDAADGLGRLIQSSGYEAKVVYNGQDAITETAEFQPDMVLLDIGMPGLDGYATVREIRNRRSDVHLIIVAVTAWSRNDDKRRAYDSGFDLHVAKPMSRKTLDELLTLLDPTRSQAAPQQSAPAIR